MGDYVCENCYGSFVDPICEECQLKEFEAWLIDKGYHKINREIILRVLKKRLLAEDNNIKQVEEDFCVVCNKQHVFSCPDCFNFNSLQVLKKFHANQKEVDNFLRTFEYSPRKEIMLRNK